jgi:catechol 2,3-dioxygenase-like lactoylglutathione lyase family enzyme
MAPPIDSQITFLPTPDLEATHAFYADVLGLELVLDQGVCRIYRSARDAFLGFCKKDAAASGAGVILTLVSDDVDGWYASLVERGVTFEKPPALNPDFQIYHCFFRDPNGYLLEIQRFEDPRWASRIT